jgi:hypothetical protein
MNDALARGVDAKDRVVTGNRFERGYGIVVRNWEVLTATGGNLAPCLDDWGSLLRWNFSQHHGI